MGGLGIRDLIRMIARLRLRGLFLEPTEVTAVQTFRACFVGGFAFAADAGLLWAVGSAGVHYAVAAAFGFALGVTVNYLLSVRFVFTRKASMGRFGEVTVYLAVSLVGLAITEAIMLTFTECAGFHFMASKCVATVVSFAWNFTSRKMILYRK